MLADTPLAFLDTLADAAARPHTEFAYRCERASAGNQQALFVAEAGRRLIGQAGGFVHPTEPDRTLLYAVYISPSHRGGAILGTLVEAVAEWSRASGRPLLELEVVTTNVRADRAYRRLGFTLLGEPVPHPIIAVLTEQRMIRLA